jgi:hypothetical protein
MYILRVLSDAVTVTFVHTSSGIGGVGRFGGAAIQLSPDISAIWATWGQPLKPGLHALDNINTAGARPGFATAVGEEAVELL